MQIDYQTSEWFNIFKMCVIFCIFIILPRKLRSKTLLSLAKCNINSTVIEMVRPWWRVGIVLGGRIFICVNSQVKSVGGSEIFMPLPSPSNAKISGELYI